MKTIILDNIKFTKTADKNYHYNTKLRKYLHQYIWEKHFGEIPKGYEIHHIDGDTCNNLLNNLQMLDIKSHKRLHWNDYKKEWARKNIKENALPKAIEWHKSEDGKEWHKANYEKNKDKFHQKQEFECQTCGEMFIGTNNGVNRFCSNNCKSSFRRKSGVDNITRTCSICNSEFVTNKYSKATTCSRGCSAKLRQKLKDSLNLQE